MLGITTIYKTPNGTLRLAPLFLTVVGFAAMGGEVPNSAWGLRYPPWREDIAERFELKKSLVKKNCKSQPPFFSYLALGTPVPFWCWLCGNGSGGVEFSLRAEISTVAQTVQNNLIEQISGEEAR